MANILWGFRLHIFYCTTFPFSTAAKERDQYMSSVSFKSGVPHIIDRNDIFSSVLQLFDSEDIMREYRMRIGFKGELAVDTGFFSRNFVYVLGSCVHKVLR